MGADRVLAARALRVVRQATDVDVLRVVLAVVVGECHARRAALAVRHGRFGRGDDLVLALEGLDGAVVGLPAEDAGVLDGLAEGDVELVRKVPGVGAARDGDRRLVNVKLRECDGRRVPGRELVQLAVQGTIDQAADAELVLAGDMGRERGEDESEAGDMGSERADEDESEASHRSCIYR